MIKEILFQVIIIIFPLLFHHSYIKKKITNLLFQRIITAGLCSIVIVICMYYPVSLGKGGIYDLRSVPWMLSFMYGGGWVGIATTIVLCLFRYWLGGNGMYTVFIVYPLAAIFLILTNNYYTKVNLVKKIQYGVAIAGCLIITIVCLSFVFIPEMNITYQSLFFFIFLTILNVITLWSYIWIREFIDEHDRLHLEVQRTEKIHIVGQLAASVAHEVRNPLTTIKGFLQMLSQDQTLSAEHKYYVSISLEEINRANSIIQDYLSLAKTDIHIERLNIADEIQFIQKSIGFYAVLHNVILNFHHPASNLCIKGNREKFRQVLLNLIKNSIEAVQQKGKGKINVRILKKERQAVIEIEDDGIGMNPEELQRLGLPFYSTKESGTGLGTMVSYKIIESMHGEIKVVSEEGKGTCFSIFLPLEPNSH
jgi:two-component system sporulation sensor kinase B